MAEGRIAVLGGRGMLGSDVVSLCREQGREITVLDLPEFDITKASDVEESLCGTDLVVNCAAYTDVEKAESEPDLAFKVNTEGAGRVGAFAKKAGIWVLHISTDFVFDGRSERPYVETDAPKAINSYGSTKLAGERLLVASGCSHCIMRLEWTYGLNGSNFVTKLIERAKSGETLRVVDDQRGTPTATTEAAKVICKLLAKMPEGVFHFASAGYVSRFDMARFILDRLGISVDLQSCKSSDYVTAAERPLNSCFDCSKISEFLGEPIRPWQEPLEEFLRQL